MLISNIFLDARLELFELPDEDCNGLFQMLSLFVLSLAKNQEIQRDTKIDSNLGKKIHPTDIFASFNTTQDTPVHVQFFRKSLLRIAVLLTDLADTRSALFLVIEHFYNLQSQNLGNMRFEIGVVGISLCKVAIGAAAPENPTKTDKAKCQTVFETVWHFALPY